MGRLANLDPNKISGYQKELYDRIAAARGAVRGPFNAWLYSPELCDRVEALGKYVRFDSDVSMRLKEVAVLVVARHFDADYMWVAHAKFAAKEGVSDPVIEAIRKGDAPVFEQPDEQIVHDYTKELLEVHRVSDATWAKMLTLMDQPRLVEFTAFIGNFSMVGLALNAFEVDLPGGVTPPLSASEDA